MSTIDFHDDEWGRHWSHAPLPQQRAPRRSRSSFAGMRGWIEARLEELRARSAEQRDRKVFEGMSAEALRDIFPEDAVLPVRADRLDGIRDAFGRPLA
ncbi:hypothetical protein [Labrys monachus]|uniref:Uncharacterized protein n=1 Tax=Labrys monachus TaxID=217067 RepID=A0ABU0F9S4_9HYPH|nr:hypothetical protein [Labrys monachus]MDQ0390828.1 hypothetical protein [Labrys monachus]